MFASKAFMRKALVRPSSRAALKERDCALPLSKKKALRFLEENMARLAKAQELLYASHSHGVLIVLQGMDAAGKDGTVKHVMSGVNPQGCEVHSFKRPSDEELSHTFLWRYAQKLPARGHITIFNRSYYEDVLVTRVHPELLGSSLGKRELTPAFWRQRLEDINAFERHLTRNKIVVLKFFLHISREEQRQRLLARLDDKDKIWKFSRSDLAERAYWKDYVKAYEQALSATSTAAAPWYVIPSDHKTAAHLLVAEIVTEAIRGLRLHFPKAAPELARNVAALEKQLKQDA